MINRKLRIGIIYTLFLIFIQILFALTYLLDFNSENYNEKKVLVYQVSNLYVYVSVLLLIRKLVVDNSLISKYLTWIIRLEILKVLSYVLVSLNIYQSGILFSSFLVILLVLYIILILEILNKKYYDNIVIKGLRPFVIASTIGFSISLIGGIYAEYNHVPVIYGIIYLILAIPYFLIIKYFNQMKSKTEQIPNC